MKKLNFILILLLLPVAAWTQDSDSTIINLVNKWWSGWVEKDSTAFIELADENFMEFTGNHTKRLEGKKKLLQVAKAVFPLLEIEDWKLEDPKVIFHSNTAICHYFFSEYGEFGGKPFKDIGCATDTYVKKQGKWKLVSHHGTKFNKLLAQE